MDVFAGWKVRRLRATYSAGPTHRSTTMKSLLIAGIMSVAFATAGHADQYWVSGDRITGGCNITSTQPITFSLPAFDGSTDPTYRTSWTSGPYQSLDDAKLARSGIGSCASSSSEPADDKEKD